jgi:hypothetical protein
MRGRSAVSSEGISSAATAPDGGLSALRASTPPARATRRDAITCRWGANSGRGLDLPAAGSSGLRRLFAPAFQMFIT